MVKTFEQFAGGVKTVPAGTSWYLADLGEARGRQELFTRQAPQKLKVLREHALIESAVSSNRIEGVEVDRRRVKAVVLGKSFLQDRDEEEVRGYRLALDRIHAQGKRLSVTEKTLCDLHRLARGDIWDAGKYKSKDGDIIERYPNGRQRVRFKPVSAALTAECMAHLVSLWDQCLEKRWVHPLIALAAFNLDFLCIHPFRDGNGRVSRLLLLLQSYHLGFEAGRYISLERLIETNKDRYYETLETSSHGWHEGKHDPWPYVNYLLFILKSACREFVSRVGETKSPRGTKTEFVKAAVRSLESPFTLADLVNKCPHVSQDMVRNVLRNMQKDGDVECVGRGPAALWHRKGNTS
ncbi:MAG: Fic family protein [Desulfobacterales bacterium]|nr:Fic family protein [Desulfobacterales bacterium]